MYVSLLSLKVLRNGSIDTKASRCVFFRRQPNPRGKILVDEEPPPQNAKCIVCAKARVHSVFRSREWNILCRRTSHWTQISTRYVPSATECSKRRCQWWRPMLIQQMAGLSSAVKRVNLQVQILVRGSRKCELCRVIGQDYGGSWCEWKIRRAGSGRFRTGTGDSNRSCASVP